MINFLRKGSRKAFYYGLQKFIYRDNKKNEIAKAIENDNLFYTPVLFPREKQLRVVQYIGQLGPGGAERQLCLLSKYFHEIGVNVTALTTNALNGNCAHYYDYLLKKNIPVRMAKPCNFSSIMQILLNNNRLNRKWVRLVPPYLASYVFALVKELITIKPDVLHCWLDYSNVIGGLAGLIAGVPKIFLGGRNVNPTHFKWMYQPWFKEWYDVLIQLKRVQLLNNSQFGAEDYAQWLGIPSSRIHVIYNGLHFSQFDDIKLEDVKKFRDSLNISDSVPLVGGIFRLSSEKSPLDFIRVIKKVKEEIGDIKAIVAGIGPLEEEMKKSIKENGLEGTVMLLGRRTDVFTIMKACDVILLTSVHEGTPNVLLEAQYLGIPVVATKAGGTPEIVDDGISGLLHSAGDIQGMADSVVKILRDKHYGKKLGEQGHRRMKEFFSIDRIARSFLNVYYDDIQSLCEN